MDLLIDIVIVNEIVVGSALEKLDQKYGGENDFCNVTSKPVYVPFLSRRLTWRSWRFSRIVWRTLWLSLRIVTSIKSRQEYLHFTLRCNKSYQALFLSCTKNGCTGSPGRMDYPYFLNGYRSKLFIVWTSKKLRRELRKRQKIMSSQRNTSMREEKFTTSPENPHPSVLSAMDLTK